MIKYFYHFSLANFHKPLIFDTTSCAKPQKRASIFLIDALFSGLDGTRTRDPMRDRHVF